MRLFSARPAGGAVRRDRIGFAVAPRDDAVRADARIHEVLLHGFGAPLREPQVVVVLADVVRVAGDLDPHLGIRLERSDDLVENRSTNRA